MRVFGIVCVAILFASTAVVADAPGGKVSVYTDATGSGDCFLAEQLGTLNSIWVVHRNGPPAQGARLRVTHNWNALLVQVSYPVIHVVEPDIFGGDYLGYGGCKTTPQWIARLDFLPLTPTPPCTAEFHVVPDPDAASGSIEVTDCDGNTVLADPDYSWIVINFDVTCSCHVDPVIIDDATWSRIKAMYR